MDSWRKARILDRAPIGPEADYLELLEVLQPLALWLRDENPEVGLIHRGALMDWLWAWHEREEGLNRHAAKEAARKFLDSVHRYSSMLLTYLPRTAATGLPGRFPMPRPAARGRRSRHRSPPARPDRQPVLCAGLRTA